MLTDAAVRKIKSGDKDRKVPDSGGLYLFVTKAGHRSWRLKYRFEGKERRLVLGTYPELGLAAARDMRDDAKRHLKEGRDPGYERKKAKLANIAKQDHLLETVAREWYEVQKPRWKAVHADDVITSLERDIFPKLGAFAVADIDKPMVLSVLRAVEARGAIETAHRLRQRLSAIFEHAEAAGLVSANPALVGKQLKRVPKGKRWPALLGASWKSDTHRAPQRSTHGGRSVKRLLFSGPSRLPIHPLGCGCSSTCSSSGTSFSSGRSGRSFARWARNRSDRFSRHGSS